MAFNEDKFRNQLNSKTPEEILTQFCSHLGSYKNPKYPNEKIRCDIIVEEKRDCLSNKIYNKYLSMTTHSEQPSLAATDVKDEVKVNNPQPYHVQVASKFLQLYRSATRRDKEFDLKLADVHNLLQQPTCYYTNVTLTLDGGPYQRTVDRIDNTKGYVVGNVVACSHLANQIKNQLFEDPTSNLITNIEFMQSLLTKLTLELL